MEDEFVAYGEDITPEGSVAPVYLVELSEDQLAQISREDKENEAKSQAALVSAEAKESARAKLAALGLTAEEVIALLG